MHEVAAVGAGIGGGFEDTSELRVMNYRQAMESTDAEGWKREIDNEHERMVRDEVWEAVEKTDLPSDAKVITTTWACKKKANGTLRGRVVAQGFQQVPHQHYDPTAVAAPVANDTTIRIALVLMLLGGWAAHIVDVKGAFLKGKFEKWRENLYENSGGYGKALLFHLCFATEEDALWIKTSSNAILEITTRNYEENGP